MKHLINIALLLFICSIAFAQKDTTQYLFKDFQESLIQYNDGRLFQVKVNYNLMQNAFMFIDVNDENKEKLFAEPEMVGNIKIGERVFRVSPNGLAIEILQWNPYLSVLFRGKARPEGKLSAYGGRSETTAIDTYSSFQNGGQQYQLETEKIILTGVDLRYAVNIKGKEKGFINLKQFLKLYPKNKHKSIEEYAKEGRIRFSVPEQVLELFNYAQSLK